MNTNTVSTVADKIGDFIWDAIGINGQFMVCLAMFMILGIVMLYMHDDFRPANQGFWKWLLVQVWKDIWKSCVGSDDKKSDEKST